MIKGYPVDLVSDGSNFESSVDAKTIGSYILTI
jgi:hypothetical protein